MSYRSQLVEAPTYAGVIVCDVCRRDMEQISDKGFKQDLVFAKFVLTIPQGDPDRTYDIDICSLRCLAEWIEQTKKHSPGFWENRR